MPSFRDSALLNMMLEWGFFYFAGVDDVEGMKGVRLYDWLVLASARCQQRLEVY